MSAMCEWYTPRMKFNKFHAKRQTFLMKVLRHPCREGNMAQCLWEPKGPGFDSKPLYFLSMWHEIPKNSLKIDSYYRVILKVIIT